MDLNLHHNLERSLDQFYIPFEGKHRSALIAQPEAPSLVLERFAIGLERPTAAVKFSTWRGTKVHDWINTTFAQVILISERLRIYFKDAKFTGWSTYPVELRDPGGDPIEGYTGLSFDGRCGRLDDSSVPITLERSKWTGQMCPVRKGYYFNIDTWDGTDFFAPDGTTMGLVTDRVRVLLEKHKIKNVVFERLTEFTRIGTIEVNPPQ